MRQGSTRSLLKESKYHLYDTGAVEGSFSARLENTVACALMRELHFLEDTTGSRVGSFEVSLSNADRL